MAQAHACPVCGGEVDVRLGDRFARCGYCRASVVVEGGTLIGRYVVRQRLTADAATSALRRWMQGNEPVAGLAALCTVEAPTFDWLPVWYARTKADRGFVAHEARADDERLLEVKQRLIPPGALQRLREERPDLPAPTIAVDAFRNQTLSGLEVTELALVHVPCFRFVYAYRGRRYSAVVDAATGEVRPGRFPAKPELPFALLTAATLGAYLIAHAIVIYAYQDHGAIPHVVLVAYPVTLAVSALLAVLLLALI